MKCSLISNPTLFDYYSIQNQTTEQRTEEEEKVDKNKNKQLVENQPLKELLVYFFLHPSI